MKVIYSIQCKITNKQYIGSALNHEKRKREHFYNLKNNKHPNKKLQNAYNKYGADCFEFKIIEVVNDEKKLIEREQHYIDDLKPIYNICRVAGSSLGLKRTNDTRDKIRAANLGIKHPQWRNEIKSKAQGGENHWTKKKSFSEDAKKKMSNSQKELYKNGYVHPNKKKIIQYSLSMILIKEWESAADAERVLGISRFAIAQVLRGHNKTCGGYIWKYNN